MSELQTNFKIIYFLTYYAIIDKYINVSSFESSESIQMIDSGSYRAISDNESSSVVLDKLAMNARRLY